jgi:hypothetical protein
MRPGVGFRLTRQGHPRRHQWPTTPLAQEEATLIAEALKRHASVASDMARAGWVRIAHALAMPRRSSLGRMARGVRAARRTPAGLTRCPHASGLAHSGVEIELAAARNATGLMEKAAQLQRLPCIRSPISPAANLDMVEMLRRTHAVVAGLDVRREFLHRPVFAAERDTARFVYFRRRERSPMH